MIMIGTSVSKAQDIELFQQFNGRFDYTAIGNTLNPAENNIDQGFCFPLESSSATLNLPSDINILAAYLYWAGSGPGDTSVILNGMSVEAEETYNVDFNSNSGLLTYFSCYSEITDQIILQGNTTYEFSGLDLTEVLTINTGYCGNRTNFAGWSIYIIYQDDNLPLNQVNLYQGLEIINENNQEKTIIIDNLNVIDNIGAKIGFLAWEGDNNLNFGESLLLNGNVLSNPPLNLSDNAFNGTNSFNNATDFYNCDLDVYDIEDNIAIGDMSATIKMTTGDFDETGQFQADLIIINNIITVLNSQLPDATITINNVDNDCGNRVIEVDYTVFNNNSTEILPEHTPIAFYAEGMLVAQSQTQSNIAIGGSENGFITIALPDDIPADFLLQITVDDDGTGNGVVTETNENNNNDEQIVNLLVVPPVEELPQQIECNEGFSSAEFDLVAIFRSYVSTQLNFSFFESFTDLESDVNEILMPDAYSNGANPITIYVKVDDQPCYQVYAVTLTVTNCPPNIPEGFSPNGDGINDWFNIEGLYDIFEQHELKIFNRYGTLIFEGNNNTKWNGLTNRGLNNIGKRVPVGTYFYLLYLNDPNFPSQTGWVYVNY